MQVREENPIKPSMFPEEDENGYSFFDQITCNLQSLVQYTHLLFLSFELPIVTNKQYNKQMICPFNIKLLLCKGNKHCFKQLETYNQNDDNTQLNYTLTNDLMLIKEIYDTNCFHYKSTDTECQEIPLYWSILDGYLTYKTLQEHSNNCKYVRANIASSYEKLNNLFLLLSLGVKTSIDLGQKDIISQDNNTFILKSTRECIQLNNLETLTSKHQNEFLNNLAKVKQLLQCSKLIDSNNVIKEIEGIEVIFKNFNDLEINQIEAKQSLKVLLKGIIASIDYLFSEDLRLKQQSSEDQTNFKLFNVIFWSFMVMLILFVNKYFVKHQEFYSSKSKKFFGKVREGTNNSGNNNTKGISNNNASNIDQGRSNSKNNTKGKVTYTKEELEYIDKLTKVKGKTEFVIAN